MDNVKQKSLKYTKAFKEVYILINDLADDLYVRIPKSFIEMIKENMDEDYDITLKEINLKGEMEETRVLMSLIFRDFLCNDDLSEKLKEYDKNQVEKQLERYNNIFGTEEENGEEKIDDKQEELDKERNNVSNEVIEEPKQEVDLAVISEEKWYQKIWNKIKSLFYKS